MIYVKTVNKPTHILVLSIERTFFAIKKELRRVLM